MPTRTIAIGDIHGHSAALTALVAVIDPQPSDTIVLLGDYIDRGPDSRGVLEQIIELGKRCHTVPLIGNHEEMMIRARTGQNALQVWLTNGGDAALRSYGDVEDFSRIPPVHFDLLMSLRRFHETDTHFFIHANYAPNWRLDQHDSTTALWLPLTDLPGPHYSGKIAILGHTPQQEGRVLDLGHLVCIDTGCGFGGLLTALDVESGRLWQVDELGREV